MIAENYTMNCYCEVCTMEPARRVVDFDEFIGPDRASATRDLRANGSWISRDRQYYLCRGHNTRKNRKALLHQDES